MCKETHYQRQLVQIHSVNLALSNAILVWFICSLGVPTFVRIQTRSRVNSERVYLPT